MVLCSRPVEFAFDQSVDSLHHRFVPFGLSFVVSDIPPIHFTAYLSGIHPPPELPGVLNRDLPCLLTELYSSVLRIQSDSDNRSPVGSASLRHRNIDGFVNHEKWLVWLVDFRRNHAVCDTSLACWDGEPHTNRFIDFRWALHRGFNESLHPLLPAHRLLGLSPETVWNMEGPLDWVQLQERRRAIHIARKALLVPLHPDRDPIRCDMIHGTFGRFDSPSRPLNLFGTESSVHSCHRVMSRLSGIEPSSHDPAEHCRQLFDRFA